MTAPGLIETLRGDAMGIRFLARHMGRLEESAAALGIACPRQAIVEALNVAATDASAPQRLRVEVGPDGTFEITVAPLGPMPERPLVAVSCVRVDSRDPLLRHKTTRRAAYEEARAALAGLDGGFDALLCNERGELCEGGITNLFVLLDGQLLTPPVACGLLPGIMRRHAIEAYGAREAVLRRGDLRRARRIFLTNALRGMVEVGLAD